MKELTVIGRAERVDLPDYGLHRIPAKVDTGADSSSIWATRVKATKQGLEFYLFGPSSRFYTGQKIAIAPKEYSQTQVLSAGGKPQVRYKTKLKLRVQGRTVRATMTLANRQQMTYPILLGRRLLANKFVVDVSKGQPLQSVQKPWHQSRPQQLLNRIWHRQRGKK